MVKFLNQFFPYKTLFKWEKKDKVIYFTAFSKLFEDDTGKITTKNWNIMLTQNNYTNIYISILGEQIVSINERLDKLIIKVQKISKDTTKGKEQIATASIQPPPEVKDFKLRCLEDLEKLLDEKCEGFKISPLNLEHLSDEDKRVKLSDEINKISEKFARKSVQRMFYYPRPTPQDVLLEEPAFSHYSQSYKGTEIYEWNIDGFTDRQIYTQVHRMLMYNTICKVNKNSGKTIADMIVAGFTGQLKGWLDNYLNSEQRAEIMGAIKVENGQNVQNAVYSLFFNIIEHFSGRW